MSDAAAKDASRALAESMATEWPSVQMQPHEFIDYSVEKWAHARRAELSLNVGDIFFVPPFLFLFTFTVLMDAAGFPWWQALPMAIPASALITAGFFWLRRNGWMFWE